MTDEIQRSLGRIEGRLEKLDSIEQRLDSLDSRVKSLEVKGAAAGGAAGLITSVFVSVLAYNLRSIGGGN